jgi:hypothetical protein
VASLRLPAIPGPAPADNAALRAPLANFLDEFRAARSVQGGMTVDRATLERMRQGAAAARPLTAPLVQKERKAEPTTMTAAGSALPPRSLLER